MNYHVTEEQAMYDAECEFYHKRGLLHPKELEERNTLMPEYEFQQSDIGKAVMTNITNMAIRLEEITGIGLKIGILLPVIDRNNNDIIKFNIT